MADAPREKDGPVSNRDVLRAYADDPFRPSAPGPMLYDANLLLRASTPARLEVGGARLLVYDVGTMSFMANCGMPLLCGVANVEEPLEGTGGVSIEGRGSWYLEVQLALQQKGSRLIAWIVHIEQTIRSFMLSGVRSQKHQNLGDSPQR